MAETLLQLFEERVNESGHLPALRARLDDGWERVSWKEWWDRSERIAAGFIDLGVEPGERVVVLAHTRLEWVLVDMAIWMIGAVSVPIFPSSLPAMCKYIANDCGPSLIVAQDPSQLDKWLSVREHVPSIRAALVMDDAAVCSSPDWRGRREVRLESLDLPPEWGHTLDSVEARGRRLLATEFDRVTRHRLKVSPHDSATIVYTSGTSDQPKGVELTHRNLTAEIQGLQDLRLLQRHDVQLLILPLAHIFARILYLTGITYGIETALVGDASRLVEACQEVQPTFFAGVPQIFERVRSRLLADAHRHGGLKASLFDRAFDVGRRLSETNRDGGTPSLLLRAQEKVFDELVFSRIAELFGGRVRFLISGGAPLAIDVAEFFHAAGILVMEGYGLTEGTAVAAVNVPDEFRFGTVGRPVPGVEVTIDEDGEILLRGATVMKGYFGQPEATKRAIDSDGWLHTGDLGEYDRGGFLRVTGRKKDVLVTAGGKNIAPAHIEGMLAASPLVERAMAVGDGRPYVVALLAADLDALRRRCAEEGVEVSEPLHLDPAVQRLIAAHVESVNGRLATYQTIKRFALLPDGFSGEGELTPTSKIRRNEVISHHAELIDSLYREGR